MYAIKAAVGDPSASSWTFKAQKTMYGGKRASKGDLIFGFASENEVAPAFSPAAPSRRSNPCQGS